MNKNFYLFLLFFYAVVIPLMLTETLFLAEILRALAYSDSFSMGRINDFYGDLLARPLKLALFCGFLVWTFYFLLRQFRQKKWVLRKKDLRRGALACFVWIPLIFSFSMFLGSR